MEKIKSLWENKKVCSIALLIFYIALFSYIFIVYGGQSENIILPSNIPEHNPKKTYTSYEYEYIFEDKITKVLKKEDIINFTYEENDYYCFDNKCYKLIENMLHETENPLKYNYDYLLNLDKIVELSTLVKTSIYANGIEETNYDVNFSKVLELYNVFEEVDANEVLNYSVDKKDKEIVSISLNNLNIKFNYLRFDNIEDINVDYEIYKEEE